MIDVLVTLEELCPKRFTKVSRSQLPTSLFYSMVISHVKRRNESKDKFFDYY